MHRYCPHDFIGFLALYASGPDWAKPLGLAATVEASPPPPIPRRKRRPRPSTLRFEQEEVGDKPKPSPRWQLRESHLKARRYFPTHPFLKISKILPFKLPTMAEVEAMSHEELARRFLKTSRAFPCRPVTAWK